MVFSLTPPEEKVGSAFSERLKSMLLEGPAAAPVAVVVVLAAVTAVRPEEVVGPASAVLSARHKILLPVPEGGAAEMACLDGLLLPALLVIARAFDEPAVAPATILFRGTSLTTEAACMLI